MAEHWNGGNGGKGSRARPFSISQEEYDNRWEVIFGRDKDKTQKDDNTGTNKNEYQDVLSTEDCLTMPMPGTIGAAEVVFKEEEDKTTRYNQETQEVKNMRA